MPMPRFRSSPPTHPTQTPHTNIPTIQQTPAPLTLTLPHSLTPSLSPAPTKSKPTGSSLPGNSNANNKQPKTTYWTNTSPGPKTSAPTRPSTTNPNAVPPSTSTIGSLQPNQFPSSKMAALPGMLSPLHSAVPLTLSSKPTVSASTTKPSPDTSPSMTSQPSPMTPGPTAITSTRTTASPPDSLSSDPPPKR